MSFAERPARRVGQVDRERNEVVALAVRSCDVGLTYEQVAERLLLELDGEARITKDAVAALIRRQAAEPREPDPPKGLSPRTVRYVHTILHAALKDALRWNLVARNVADAAIPPSAAAVRSHRPKACTAEQLRSFLDYTSDSQYLPAWIFLATSGCRRGECLGLRWSDVDLDEATAIIARHVTALDHQVIVKELPKTKQAHLIRLDSGTVSMLRKLRAEQAETKLRLGGGHHVEGYVFCQPDGRPYHPDQQIPTITLHGLRHTWATLARGPASTSRSSASASTTAAPTSPGRSTLTSPHRCKATLPSWSRT